ncbi:MAG: YraN family protein [Candidatus Gastranaerophilales bacterium]|nr:YraN family protein [Candidatus Gastranaerophilales bacterium]
MINNRTTGNNGEDLAVEFLQQSGFKIIERNWHYGKLGEIDIIAVDKDVLVFVEVKARRSLACGHPLEAISYKKLEQIKMTGLAYLSQCSQKYNSYRFDAISVILGHQPQIELVKNIFG